MFNAAINTLAATASAKPSEMNSQWFRSYAESICRTLDDMSAKCRAEILSGTQTDEQWSAFLTEYNRLLGYLVVWEQRMHTAEEFETISDASSFAKN